MKNYHWH